MIRRAVLIGTAVFVAAASHVCAGPIENAQAGRSSLRRVMPSIRPGTRRWSRSGWLFAILVAALPQKKQK